MALTTGYRGANCPKCGKLLDAATSATGGVTPPRSGDLTVCIQCAAALVFTDDLRLRLMTGEEMRDAPKELFQAIGAIRSPHLKGGKA